MAQEEVAQPQEDTEVARQPLVANGQIANIECDMGPCAGPDASYHYCLYHDTTNNEVKMDRCAYWHNYYTFVDRRTQPAYRWQAMANSVQNYSQTFKNMASNKCIAIVNIGGTPAIRAITCNTASTEQAWNEANYWSGDPAHQNLVISNWSPYLGWGYGTIRAHMSTIQPGQPIVPWNGPDGVNYSTDWRPTLAP